MKKTVFFAVVFAFVVVFGMGSVVSADEMVPGAYAQPDASVMGVGQTMVQMGARDRALTNALNRASRADRSRNSDSLHGQGFQWGQSQTEQSWKKARTVAEAEVRGLVAGDCQGDNSTAAYRQQMNQSRAGYMKEPLVSNKDCGAYHPTVK